MSWSEPAVIWALIVGESGTMKSPALDHAIGAARKRQDVAYEVYEAMLKGFEREEAVFSQEIAEWRKNKSGQKPTKPQEPTLERFVCSDITIEALAELLSTSPRGLLVITDEASTWLGGFDRYTKGTGDVGHWLTMFGARTLIVDRKTGDKKTIRVPRASVSITGTIQPGALVRHLGREYFERGLAARLLFAMPKPRIKRWTEADVDGLTNLAFHRNFTRLYDLKFDENDEPIVLSLTEKARDAWITFYNEHAVEQTTLHGDLAWAWSKLEGVAARLALIHHCLRWACKDKTLNEHRIDEQSVRAGVTLARWFGRETERVYSLFGDAHGSPSRYRQLLTFIAEKQVVTIRDVIRGPTGIDSADGAERIVAELINLGVLCKDDRTPSGKGGRPTAHYRFYEDGPESGSAQPVTQGKSTRTNADSKPTQRNERPAKRKTKRRRTH